MPIALAKKFHITAAADGLLLLPIQSSRARSPPASPQDCVKIDYNTNKISTCAHPERPLAADPADQSGGIEAHGIVGLLNVTSNSFLIIITDRAQVATIRGKHPVYVITNIALIPLSAQTEAATAIAKARTQKRAPSEAASDTEDEEELGEDTENPVVDAEVQEEIEEAGKAAAEGVKGESEGIEGIVDNVLKKKGAYGRFTTRWFSKRGWALDQRRAEGMSVEPTPTATPVDRKPENQPAPATGEEEVVKIGKKNEKEIGDGEGDAMKVELDGAVEEATETVKDSVAHSLTPKLLHTTKLLLATSRSFYFSYTFDLTRSWDTQVSNPSNHPLFKIVDPDYFWNHHLQQEFIDAGQHGLVLPLLQGFVAQRPFSATSSNSQTPEPGADNSCEGKLAESQIHTKDFATDEASTGPSDDSQDLIVTLISRRSIRRAGLRYLRRGIDDDGNVANAVETEQILSTPSWDKVFSYLQIRGSIPLYFSQSPYSLRPRPVLLLTEVENTAAAQTHFQALKKRYGEVQIVSLVEKHGNEAVVGDKYRDTVASLNSSTPLNINWTWFDFHKECRGMRFENVSRLFDDIGDTLDSFSYSTTTPTTSTGQRGILRTNCMDCLDRTNVVQSGAARRALLHQLSTLSTPPPNLTFLDNMWADNGDAISKQYASTAALKGQFTRTKKRTYQGALTDFGLTMTRFFTNIISDFFTQATIDYLLGNVTSRVFSDFEAEMATHDPRISMRRIRANAVEIAAKIVVADEDERVQGGWTFLTPNSERNLRNATTEKVLLLTDRALYLCAFDWPLEKVSAFERVPVEDVTAVSAGAYITATLSAGQIDPERNAGFVVSYEPSERIEVIRVNTRAMTNSFEKEARKEGAKGGAKRWVFKAMRQEEGTERECVQRVVGEVGRVCKKEVAEEDVLGLEEARKGTGLWEQWGYAVKKLVWA